MSKNTDMVWNVYREDYYYHRRDICVFNVFDHGLFRKEVEDLLEQKIYLNEFLEKLDSIASYYFSSKCEHEIVITSFPPYISKKQLDKMIVKREENDFYNYMAYLNVIKKVDIYQQLRLNWDRFVDYVWEFKE